MKQVNNDRSSSNEFVGEPQVPVVGVKQRSGTLKTLKWILMQLK